MKYKDQHTPAPMSFYDLYCWASFMPIRINSLQAKIVKC